jgi:SAM-dependent MidA family methyltransferase
MRLALYDPHDGYYSGSQPKFGAGGDFVTAPELGPLFGRCLARQIAQVLAITGGGVLELGAGSGALAATLLSELAQLGSTPEQYAVLEVSGHLRHCQMETLARFVPAELHRVTWLDRLPADWIGCVIGNEVLDALPVELIEWDTKGIFQVCVGASSEGLVWRRHAALNEVLAAARELVVAPPYRSEIGLEARALVRTLAERLRHGVLLLCDYGFPRREFYHPQRNTGTLRCHYRQHAHDSLLLQPGLHDISAHVDFSALRDATGLPCLGYTSQANFLLNCGLAELLGPAKDTPQYWHGAQEISRLTSPAEMGELFKLIAFGAGELPPLLGFSRADRRASL